jgi:lysozyme
MNYDRLFDSIIKHEGEVKYKDRHFAYDDATGKRLERGDRLQGHLTIGTGRNLSAKGISEVERNVLLRVDVDEVVKIMPHKKVWDQLDDVRQEVLVEMCFILGRKGLMNFKKMWVAVSAGLFDEAANQIEDSLMYNQIGSRGVALAGRMRTGKY